MPLVLLLIAIFLTAAFLTGCSPLYVVRAAYEEGKILLGRESIPDVIADPSTSPEVREKLELVMRARNFAESIGLSAGESFTQYSHIEKDVLAWVMLACKKDAFEPYTWWYPVVGTVPYKGYFEKEDAECDVNRLEQRGYEVWIRGTEAFSTLGWFNDPVLTTTIKHEGHDVANTVIHEIFHQTVWIPGSVDFNESAANVIGNLGAITFFEQELSQCTEEECRAKAMALLEGAKRNWEIEKELGTVLTEVKQSLEALYSSEATSVEKIAQRDEVFLQSVSAFNEKYPKAKVLRELNNAAILQLFIYRKELPLFESLFLKCNSDWSCFLGKLRQIAKAEAPDPYTMLKESMLKESQ